MSSLPSNWVVAPLGDLLTEVLGGGTPDKSKAENFRGDIPFMTVKDMHSRFIDDTQDHISQEALASSASRVIPADTLVIASRMSLGKVARPTRAVAINQDLKALFLHQGVSKPYIEYAWRANAARIQAMGTGTTVKGIRLEDIRGLQVPVAPAAEQTRIADQLDTLLARIQACQDRLEAIPAVLKRFRQAALDAAMTGELTNDWRTPGQQGLSAADVIATRLGNEKGAARRKLEEFLLEHPPQEPGAGLPSGWLRTHVGVVGAVSNGSTPSRGVPEYWGGDIPWVSSGEVANRTINTTRESITSAGFENSSVRLLPAGTVLMAMIGEGKTRGQSALLAIPACINQNVAGVVPVPELVASRYLWYWFQRQYESNRNQGSGSGPKALNCDRVRRLEVHLPPLGEQAEIVRRLEATLSLADGIAVRCASATVEVQRLAPLTLAKAFRGDLVAQDPNDEPASVLLARIATERIAPVAAIPARLPRIRRPPRAPKEIAAMTKSRQDDDVMGQPYLAGHLRRIGTPVTAEALFKAAELPVADFYKQLAWEVDQGHVKDNQTTLEPGHAAG